MAVMGHAMASALQLYSGASPRTKPELKRSVDNLVTQAETQPNLASSERRHVKAVKLLADGSVLFFDSFLFDNVVFDLVARPNHNRSLAHSTLWSKCTPED